MLHLLVTKKSLQWSFQNGFTASLNAIKVSKCFKHRFKVFISSAWNKTSELSFAASFEEIIIKHILETTCQYFSNCVQLLFISHYKLKNLQLCFLQTCFLQIASYLLTTLNSKIPNPIFSNSLFWKNIN